VQSIFQMCKLSSERNPLLGGSVLLRFDISKTRFQYENQLDLGLDLVMLNNLYPNGKGCFAPQRGQSFVVGGNIAKHGLEAHLVIGAPGYIPN
jgi:hypothetical protein